MRNGKLQSAATRKALLLVSFCAIVFLQPAYVAGQKNITKAKGHLQSVSLEQKLVVIDDRQFQMAEDCVVVDKSGTTMQRSQYKSLRLVDLVEYSVIKGTNILVAIKILRYAS